MAWTQRQLAFVSWVLQLTLAPRRHAPLPDDVAVACAIDSLGLFHPIRIPTP